MTINSKDLFMNYNAFRLRLKKYDFALGICFSKDRSILKKYSRFIHKLRESSAKSSSGCLKKTSILLIIQTIELNYTYYHALLLSCRRSFSSHSNYLTLAKWLNLFVKQNRNNPLVRLFRIRLQ